MRKCVEPDMEMTASPEHEAPNSQHNCLLFMRTSVIYIIHELVSLLGDISVEAMTENNNCTSYLVTCFCQ
jgi:hypothetical protein